MSEPIIPVDQELLELEIECPYNDSFKNTPDMLQGHLIEAHEYSTTQVNDWFSDWVESEPLIENCKNHGRYNILDGCYGCYHTDQEIDEWQERQWQKKKEQYR